MLSECLYSCFSYRAFSAHAPSLSSVACVALTYLSILSHKRHDWGGGDIGYKMRVSSLDVLLTVHLSPFSTCARDGHLEV